LSDLQQLIKKYITWWIEIFSCCKAFTGNSFPMEFLPRVGLRILTQVEDMDGILVFYWFFIILEATTYAFKLQ